MILFLNFAPITFMGGAEKWMNDTAKKIGRFEKTYLLSVSERLADIYGQLVLKRKFDSRVKSKSLHNHFSLDLNSFIPLTQNWKKARIYFKESEIIYAKYELLEFLIILYFLGPNGFKKTIAGLHSPFIYSRPETFFDRLHNLVYSSPISLKLLSSSKKVHAINNRDYQFLKQERGLKNVIFVPNCIEEKSNLKENRTDANLNILFVGELSKRKGVDILIEIIRNSPANFKFIICGDGPLKENLKQLPSDNFLYKGYLSQEDLKEVYKQSDVLILPSKAESMPLSILEALSFGLVIADSSYISLGLKKGIEYSSQKSTPADYLIILGKINSLKKSGKLKKDKIRQYFKQNFSTKKIEPQLYRRVFNINL